MASNPNSICELQDIVGEAILQQQPYIVLAQGTKQDDVRKAIRVYMRKHPEIFWFSHQYRFDEAASTLYLKYNFTPKKKEFFSKEIDNAVRFLFQPDKLNNLSDLEKVAYVYKWIVDNTTYNEYSSFNQTIYSVLINRNSVCTGYAKTAQYLLDLLGIESEMVFGKFHADKSDGGRHGWNIIKIDGEWYHVDFCLADPSLKYLLNNDETQIEYDGLLWNYFCKPTDYILKNRSIEFLEHYPECKKAINQRFKISLANPLKQLAVCKSDSGTTAKVHLDSFNKNQIIKVSRRDPSLIENEYRILNQLDGCKHVIQLVDRNDSGLVLEQLTPWSELLNSHYYHPSEEQLKDILIQLAEGLIECKDKGITYSDIHYNNVFVTKNGIYKWGDFGIAYPSKLDGKMPPNMLGEDGIALGSRWFMAPETYREGIFTEASAIYSMAMLAYFVMNDMRPPFLSTNISEENALEKRLSGDVIPPPVQSTSFESLSRLICDILNSDSETRKITEILPLPLDSTPSTFEGLILFLKSGIIEDEITILPNQDYDVILIGDNDAGCIDVVSNQSLSWELIDSDLFAQTMGGLRHSESLMCDNDDFATSIIQSKSSEPWNDESNFDTDSFARTCGFRPSPVSPSAPCRPKSMPNACPNPTHNATSFFPAKNKTKSAEKTPRKKFGIGTIVGSAFNLFGGIFTGFAAGAVDSGDNAEQADDISTCLYAPSEVIPNKSFIIRVYMYLPNEQDAVDSKVNEIDPKAVKKEYKPLDIPVKNGDKLTVQLDLSDGVECKNTVKNVTWRGHYTDCSFMAKLIDASQDSIEGTAYVLVNDIPAGEMLFTIDVVEAKPRELYTKVESHRFSKIFISYAHQDESQVRGIAEGCRMLGKDYFFDRHSLQAGDIFKDKILDYINNADLFVLCWSKNAAESEWVQIEREHALRLIREGKSSLSIYPLCLRPEAPLPLDMSDKYNFGTL